ncbi:hypothetical protein ES703_106801 [subsurface metagenome]
MVSRHLPLPNYRNYEYGYQSAYELACKELAKIDDIEQLCLKSGAQYQEADSKKTIILGYLNRSYQITFPDIKISLTASEEEVPIVDKVLMLHYLTLAKGTPPTNKVITFNELPEGANYFRTFSKRAIRPLLNNFGKEPHRLIEIARKLNGHKADYGDAAVTINAFNKVSVTLVLWQGDDEFDPTGSVLFDSAISDYLSTYDITVLCEIIVWKLVRFLKEAKH